MSTDPTSRRWPSRRTISFLCLAILLPALTASLLLWSFAGRSTALSSVPVAIVNGDTSVKVSDGDSTKTIAAGRQLAGALTNPSDPGEYDLDWTLTDAADASDGLASGRYYAVLTIPSTFSQAITSTSSDSPTQAELSLKSNDASNALAGTISQQVAVAAADELGDQASSAYLGNLYLGYNNISQQMTSAAGSASSLSSGAAQVDSSAAQLDGGAQSLAGSLQSLQSGTQSVSAGAASVSSGATSVAAGSASTTDGARAAAAAASSLAGGAADSSQGASTVSGAADALARDAASASDDCPEAAGVAYCARIRGLEGRARVQAGLTANLSSGLDSLSGGAQQVAGATAQVADAAASVSSGAASVAGGAASTSSGATQAAAGASSAADGANQLASGASSLHGGADSVASGAQTLATSLGTGATTVPTFTDSQQKSLEKVVTDPIVVNPTAINPSGGEVWPAALIAAIVLWLAAIASSYLRRRPTSFATVLAPRSTSRDTFVELAPVFAASGIQSLVVWLTLLVFGVPLSAALGTALITLLAGASFTLVVVALRTLWPRFGVLAALGVFAFQIACASGLLPIQTAPAVLQTLNSMLPLTAFANGFGRLAAGGSVGSLLSSVTVLAIWGAIAALVIPLVESRRSTSAPRRARPMAPASARPGEGAIRDLAW